MFEELNFNRIIVLGENYLKTLHVLGYIQQKGLKDWEKITELDSQIRNYKESLQKYEEVYQSMISVLEEKHSDIFTAIHRI